MDAVTLVGYLASGLIALAMMMKVIVRLRIVALLGSLTMGTYGALIEAPPIIAANLFIAAVHAWHLRALLFSRVHFELQPIARASHWYIERFVAFYGADIQRSHPGFDLAKVPNRRGFFILRDMLSAGLFIYSEEGDALRIHLDYVTPAFRDLRNSRFAYHEFDRRFAESPVRRFIVTPPSPEMASYYRRMGFFDSAAEPGLLERPIAG
jgi:hypothetical protein